MKNRLAIYTHWLFLCRVLLLAGLYAIAGEVSFLLSVSHSIVTLVIFAAEGFALAFVLLWGEALCLGVFLGQFALALNNGLAWHIALGIALINSIEAVIGARLFRRFALKTSLSNLRDLSGLLILIFCVLQPLSATLGTGLLRLNAVISEGQWAVAWLSWWFGNALGQALIAPLLLTLFSDNQTIKHKLSSLPWLLLLLLPSSIFLFFPISSTSITLIFAATVPLLLLFTLKGGMYLVSCALLMLSMLALFFCKPEIAKQLAENDIDLLLSLNAHLLSLLLMGQFVAVLLMEFKQLRLAEAKTSEQLQRIANHFPGIICEYRLNADGSSCFPYASQGIEKLYRITAEQVKNSIEPIFSKIHPDDLEKVVSSIQASAKNLTPWQCEYRLCFEEGEVCWFSARSLPIQQDDGAILWHGFVEDISEVKKRDIEYQTIIEASTSGFWCTDFSGRFLKVNSAACQMLGYSEQELLNMSVSAIEAIEHPEETAEHIKKIISVGHDRFETQHRCKNGTVLDVEINVLYLKELGQRLFVFVTDITERKQMQEKLHLLSTAVNQSPTSVLIVNLAEQIDYVNDYFSQATGYSREEALGQNPAVLLDSQLTPKSTRAAMWQALHQGQSWTGEFISKRKNGEIFYEEAHIAPVKNAQGNIHCYIAVKLDISERKRIETALQEYQALLKTSQRAARLGNCILNLSDFTWVSDDLFDEIVGIDKSFVRDFAHWQALIHPDDAVIVQNAFDNMSTVHDNFTHKDAVDSLCYRIIRPNDAKEIWIEAWAYLLYDEHERPVQMAGMIQDITERKQMEQALKDNEAFTLSILNSLTEHIVVLDEQGKIIMFNEAWQQFAERNDFNDYQTMFDYNYLDVCQKALTQHYDAKTYNILTGIEAILSGSQQTFQTEYECHAPHEKRWFFMTVSPLHSVKQGVVISHENITQRKVIENALLDNQALLQTAQKAARMGHYVTDILKGTWTNDAMFDEIFGIDESFNRNLTYWQTILHPDDVQRVITYFQETVSSKEQYPSIEYRIIRPNDGAIRWVAAWGHNFYDDAGNIYQQVGMLQDITERKLNEQQLQDTTEQLQLILEGGHLGFWDWNIATNEVQRNIIWAETLGYTHDEIQKTTQQWEDFVYVKDRQRAWQSIYDTLEGKTPYHELEYRMLHKDGSLRWILDHASVVKRDKNGKPIRMSGTHTDITRLKELEEQLRERERFFQLLAQINPVGIYRTDPEGQCIFVNPRWCEIAGLTEQQALGDGWSTAIMPEDSNKVYEEWMQAIHENRAFSLEYRFKQPEGNIVWVYGQAVAIHDETGKILGYVGTLTDITERKTIEEHINQLAFYDSLTKLPNRRFLRDRIKHGIDIYQRTYHRLAILMMDLDKFKAVNDNLGHSAGDELLKQVANRIKARLRAIDMVARLGGDEFVVLIENLEHDEQAAHIANAIIQTLNQPFNLNNNQVIIGTSIGIAIYPEHGNNIDDLMDNADTALYHAKDQGRGCFAYFSEILTQRTRDRIALETRLRNAITQQELRVYLQPQINIHDGKLIGAEALVRWFDPIEGMIAPNNFIPLAEETGLILAIGEWVLRETCRIGKTWLDAGLPPITLAVNVSPYQFRRCNINTLVTEILKETNFPANYLELEITESGLMENQEHAMSILNDLKNQGVRLAIDDFGTGYSSLAYLKYFPLDVLKIDKAFINNIPDSQDDTAITSTIIVMAHYLGFKVLAEGVENNEQLLFLKQNHCDMYQGYLYSAPLPVEKFEQLLKTN